MSVTALEAAKYACAASGWTLTNLQLQKILYIAHMLHLGRHGKPLIRGEEFEAWDYGPVLPSVYHHVSSFGAGRIKNVFHSIDDLDRHLDETELKALSSAVKKLKDLAPFRLVEMVHDSRGAWSQVYDPDYRGITIPNRLVEREYDNRFRRDK
ncbi:Panacea domain-containing protein [Achromobacter xylosoxidans]|uniref:Panacea domain-containing protein n=1 Tax=Alcaligenes xylosoxydans xylosoxydans TaxID=85698 RepID=UPI003EE1B534